MDSRRVGTSGSTHVDAGGHLQPQGGKSKPTQEGEEEREDASPECSHMWILLNSAADAEQGQLRCLVGFIHLQLEVRHAYEFPQRVLPEPASAAKPS